MIVLEASIQIEDGLGTFLSHLFKIPKDASHTLGNKSSSLSFKTKVDLLRDLDRISKEEYSDFILFMEIRNKLIHNGGIDTMTKAVDTLEKGKRLIKIDASTHYKYQRASSDELKELALVLAFHSLVMKLHKITSDAITKLLYEHNEQIKLEQAKILNEFNLDIISTLFKTIENYSEVMDETWNIIFPEAEENFLSAKNVMYAFFVKELKTLHPEFVLPEYTNIENNEKTIE